MLFVQGKRTTYSRSTERFDPNKFFENLELGITMNPDALSGSLKCAALCKALSTKDAALRSRYMEMSAAFTKRAIWLWEYIPSDITASLLLETKSGDGVDGAPIEIAMEAENLEFIGHPRVDRIVQKWYRPFDATNLGALLASPGELFRMPITKFYLDAVTFVVALTAFSALMTQHVKLDDDITKLEWALAVFGMSYIINELQELYQAGSFVAYLSDSWNRFDAMMCISVIIISACRGQTWTDEEAVIVDVVYLGTMIGVAVVMWLRSLFLFTILPQLGPLILTFRKMMMAVINFGVLQMLFLVGFFFAFDFVLGQDENPVPELESTRLSFFTLFITSMTGEPLPSFAALSYRREVFAQILSSFYVLIASVVLVNLLIAVMGNVVQRVSENSDAEYLFSIVDTRWRYDQSLNDLPPPFNLVVLFVWGVGVVGNAVLFSCCSQHRRIRREDRYCYHCHRLWTDGHIVEDSITTTAEWRFESLQGFSFNKTDKQNSEHMRVKTLFEEGVVCSCVRAQNTISGNRYALERISFWSFMCTLYVPLIASYFLYVLASRMGSFAYRLGSTRTPSFQTKADEEAMVESSQVVLQKVRKKNIRPSLSIRPFIGVDVPNFSRLKDSDKLDQIIEQHDELQQQYQQLSTTINSFVVEQNDSKSSKRSA
jgi:Ion transport protein